MHAIVQRTSQNALKRQPHIPQKSSASSSTVDARVVSARELQLIQSRDDILHPPCSFRAQKV